MNVRKFTAATTRDALKMVRDTLGPDAVILSNRNVNGIIEILALASEDMSSLAEPASDKKELVKKEPEKKALSEPVLAALTGRKPAERSELAGDEFDAARNTPQAAGQVSGLAGMLQAAPAATAAGVPIEITQVMNEIRAMRGMLESQLAELSWGTQQKREPHKSTVLRELLAVGFSASLARYLVEKLPANANADSGLNWAKAVLARNLNVMDNEAEILEKGGVYALVGPTGVGKTTTTAKLAARCVMRHGPSKLALITTDGYRIGGYEQLRIYGKILGVMVHSVKDESDLRIALDELKGKHTVLIDTVGVSQRDKMVQEQVAMLSSAGANVKRLLCMSATSTGETLSEVVRAYQGEGLAGAIITKLDEAATIGSVLDVVVRHRLSLYYVANGQRVPEDLHVANQQYLVDRAFKLKRETGPFEFQDMELPLVMANAARINEQGGVTLG
jgi:flagellar biosynthesis protein FlhF